MSEEAGESGPGGGTGVRLPSEASPDFQLRTPSGMVVQGLSVQSAEHSCSPQAPQLSLTRLLSSVSSRETGKQRGEEMRGSGHVDQVLTVNRGVEHKVPEKPHKPSQVASTAAPVLNSIVVSSVSFLLPFTNTLWKDRVTRL